MSYPNQPAYAAGSVLVAGPDFGTGSSREHAVWALQNYGFTVVISPRYADIFRSNSLRAGLLTVELPQEAVDQLWQALEAAPGTEITVDLAQCQVSCGALVFSFEMDDYARWRLMEGLDDIGLTLRHEGDITAYEQTRSALLPTVG